MPVETRTEAEQSRMAPSVAAIAEQGVFVLSFLIEKTGVLAHEEETDADGDQNQDEREKYGGRDNHTVQGRLC